MSETKTNSEEKTCAIIVDLLRKYSQNKDQVIDIKERFDKSGLDSLNSLLFISDLEEHFSNVGKLDIDLPVMMQHPTPELLAKYIYKNLK